MQCVEKKQSDSCDVWKLFPQENCQQIYPLVPQYLAIPCQYSAYQSINQLINQSINPAIWTVSPLQEVVFIYTVGINISSSYLYISAALTCHCLKVSFHFFLGFPCPLLPSISASYNFFTIPFGPILSKSFLHLT